MIIYDTCYYKDIFYRYPKRDSLRNSFKNTDANLELFTSETCTRWFFEHVQAKLLWARSFFLFTAHYINLYIVMSNKKQQQEHSPTTPPDTNSTSFHRPQAPT